MKNYNKDKTKRKKETREWKEISRRQKKAKREKTLFIVCPYLALYSARGSIHLIFRFGGVAIVLNTAYAPVLVCC